MSNDLRWGVLLHLSYNMWSDRPVPGHANLGCEDRLRFDRAMWTDLTEQWAAAGANLIVIDLGDGVRYVGHPEIAVADAWSPQELRTELARLRSLGLEPIPKLNFATSHDTWLKQYSRMVSTPVYYQVCADLIAEVIELFDRPRLFHLGMDEETAAHQQHYNYVVVRQHELYWHDFHFLVEQVERHGVQAWIWSDKIWHDPEAFLREVPRSVLQSNWYYGLDFAAAHRGRAPDDAWGDTAAPAAYLLLDEHGYEQVPAGSNWLSPDNFGALVDFCRDNVSPERLQGFLMTVWHPTLLESRERHEAAVAQLAAARAAWRGA